MAAGCFRESCSNNRVSSCNSIYLRIAAQFYCFSAEVDNGSGFVDRLFCSLIPVIKKSITDNCVRLVYILEMLLAER